MPNHRRSVLYRPYIDHERNNFDPVLLPEVLSLRQDKALKLAVASLKHRFLSQAEALLHGDIHSGSIFVADGRLKTIDAEFGFMALLVLISVPRLGIYCLITVGYRD